VTDRQLADALAERVLGWRPAPDRYIKSGRSWITRSRFRPLTDIRDALRLADALTKDYSLLANPGGFTAEVRHSGRIGRATARNQTRAVSLAVGKVIGIIPGGSECSPER
jgi:hypothetical protein